MRGGSRQPTNSIPGSLNTAMQRVGKKGWNGCVGSIQKNNNLRLR